MPLLRRTSSPHALESRPRTVDGITILPWRDFLSRLWSGELGK